MENGKFKSRELIIQDQNVANPHLLNADHDLKCFLEAKATEDFFLNLYDMVIYNVISENKEK